MLLKIGVTYIIAFLFFRMFTLTMAFNVSRMPHVILPVIFWPFWHVKLTLHYIYSIVTSLEPAVQNKRKTSTC